MKIMTQEQKAEAYDKVREKIALRFGNNVAEEIFSEFEESEDERIRKEIVDFICWATDRGSITREQREKSNDWLAWLEKQGQTFTKKDVDDAYLKGVCDIKQELEKQGEQKSVLDFKASNWYVSKVDGKIHDMTYNPTDKVEPKFKVKYAGSEYNVLEVKDIAGVTFYGIEDEPNHIDYVKAENCKIISGYAIKENGSAYPTNPAEWSEEDIKHFRRCLGYIEAYVEPRRDDVRWFKSLKDRVGCEVNYTTTREWSEEDEIMLKHIIINIENLQWSEEMREKYYHIPNSNKNYYQIMVDWLKFIKDRVQPQSKQEWSEEEKKRIDRIINVLDWAEDKGRISHSDWEDYVTYVKCLRPQPNTKCCIS